MPSTWKRVLNITADGLVDAQRNDHPYRQHAAKTDEDVRYAYIS